MPTITTDIIINASAEKVWSTLIAFADYPSWNPFIRNIEGELKAGGRLTVSIQPPGKKTIKFNSTILEIDPHRKLCWLRILFLPEVFDGEHCFEIEPLEDGTVKFIHSENFSGILSSVLFSFISTVTKKGLIAMNEALKARCEAAE